MTVTVVHGDVYPIAFTTSLNVQTATSVAVTVRKNGTGPAIMLPATVTAPNVVSHTLTGTLPPGRYRLAIRATWPEAGPITFPSPGSEYLVVLEDSTALPFALPSDLSAYTTGLVSPTDPRADVILRGATKAIQNYCGWNIAPAEDITKVFDGGSSMLYLPTLKLNEVMSITSTADGLLDLADFEWSETTGNLRHTDGRPFPEVWGGLSVVFNSGYEEAPEELMQIVLQVAATALASPTGATREQAGQVSMQWATTAPGVSGGLTLLERDYAVLNRYKLPKEA